MYSVVVFRCSQVPHAIYAAPLTRDRLVVIMSTPSIHFELGNLTRADGSAVAAVGDSSVQVAVHGPGDVPLHKELLEEAAIEVVFKDAARSKDGMFCRSSLIAMFKSCLT